MDGVTADDLKAELENLTSTLRKNEIRLVQYRGLTTLTNRNYKFHKSQVASLEQQIVDKDDEIEKLNDLKRDLSKDIYTKNKRIGKLEGQIETSQAARNRVAGSKGMPIKERIALLSKHSDDLHSSLNSRVHSFGSATIEKKVTIGDKVLVLNKNGTFYWEEDTALFKKVFLETFMRFLSSNETQLAIALLASLDSPADKILEIIDP